MGDTTQKRPNFLFILADDLVSAFQILEIIALSNII